MKEKFAKRMAQIRPSSAEELLKLGAQPDIINFGGGYPDPALFPTEPLQRAYEQAFRQRADQALQYGTPTGLPSLKEKLVNSLAAIGIRSSQEELILVQGSQQGLDLVAKLLCNKGDTVIVENPTYLAALASFRSYEPTFVPVKMDEQGLRMDDLEKALAANKNVKFIYTIPEFQNPTGISLSLERRQRMVELANKYDVAIVEDSPYRDVRFEGEMLPPLKSFDAENRVLYMGSFSKVLSPGLRLGYIAASREIVAGLASLKLGADIQNSSVTMHALDIFLESFDLRAHIRKLCASYKHKRDLMLRTFAESMPDSVNWTRPEGGLFTWLTLPAGASAMAVMRDRLLPVAKVAYVPGDDFYAAAPESNHCRVNYSFMPDEKIVRGVRSMGQVFTDLFK